MSCTESKRAESSKGFDCKNMGDVLGKECEKETLTRSVEDVLREEAEGGASSGAASESDSEKDMSNDSDEDLSWLLPVNAMELGAKKCKCEGCLKLFESYNSDKKNAKLLLSCWKEFRNYIRNVYINSPLESGQKNENVSFEDNTRLHEIIQVMRLCDPYLLFQKIEDEVCSMVLESRMRQLNLLKDENNPALAEEFITGLIEEYVKLLSSALQLSPAIENLLGPQLQRFGLTWEILNKQLYRSLVYNHFDVQQNLIRFIEQLRKMLPLKDDLYHELVHQYLAFDGEMTLIGTMWKNVEPLIQEYRNLKSKENEKLNNLLDAMKDFFANKLYSSGDDLEVANEENACSGSDDVMQYCPNCMTKRNCPCDECTVTHMMTCEDLLLGLESPLEVNTPSRSRSRSPLKQSEAEIKENRGEENVEVQQSCECYACTMTQPDLMDCSIALSQPTSKNNSHGEGFQLYPHIHGTASDSKNVSNLYSSLQTNTDSVYSHLYNLHSQNNSIETQSQINNTFREQLMQAIVSSKVNSQVRKSPGSPPPPPPPPPPSQETTPSTKTSFQSALSPIDITPKNSVNLNGELFGEQPLVKKSNVRNGLNEIVKKTECDKNQVYNSKVEEKKNDLGKKAAVSLGNGSIEKSVAEKQQAKSQGNVSTEKNVTEKHQTKSQGNSKGTGCVMSRLCGKCCLKHGSNCVKMSGCNKGTDKHLSAIARLGLSGNSNGRMPVKCVGGKEEYGHRNTKSHSCNKSKHQDNLKKTSNKKKQENEDSSSLEDSCSDGSNSTSLSVQKDPKHCDCCYCEVFGHGVPSVAPVSRNYQEMRERLRLRLNMKKSAKCKTVQTGQTPQQLGQKVVGVNSKPQINSLLPKGEVKKEAPNELDLESLLKYIEGKKSDCKDAKKAAKRARQKRKKQEAKAKALEEEEERKRLETAKRQVTISLVNDNKRSQNLKANSPPAKPSSQPQRIQPQTLNLSGLKSLVEKSDPNAVPKMVTIRRVMAPFSAEPTVTITLKGSTPDKDKVLFMLKNGNETPIHPEQEEISKKKKKKKKKKKTTEEEEYDENEYEPVYEPPPMLTDSSKKKKKGKNKTEEIMDFSESIKQQNQTSKSNAADNISLGKNNKLKNPKSGISSNVKPSLWTTESNKNQNSSVKKSQSINIKSASSNSKSISKDPAKQKSNSVLKTQNQNVKKQDLVSKNSKNNLDNKSVQNSVSKNNNNSNNSRNQINKNNVIVSKVKNNNSSNNINIKNKNKSNNSNNSSVSNKINSNNNNNNNNNNSGGSKNKNTISNTKSASINKNVQKLVSTNPKNQTSNSLAPQKVKNGKNSNELSNNCASEKQSKTSKNDPGKSSRQVSQANNKLNDCSSKVNQKNSKNLVQIPQKIQNQKLRNVEIIPTEKKEKVSKKSKSNKNVSMDDVEVNWRGPAERYDRGKVIINTPSYRLSEVLNSIAPSPPPKEEINLENLRLPPGITITKIEGPIAKPVKPTIQPSQVPKPAPPIVMSTSTSKPNPPPGNVIVVDTGRLKEVMKENSHMVAPETTSKNKRKKKKNKQQLENNTPMVEVPMNHTRFGSKVPKSCSPLNRGGLTVLSGMDSRKMVPLENQQATIIKTSDNMVTIRSPALQQAMNIHAYQNSHAYKSGINGYSSMSLFNEEVSRMNDKIGALKIGSEDQLTRQMRSLNLKEGNRGNNLFAQTMGVSPSQNTQPSGKKKKKKKKQGKAGEEREVEPVESVFQPKDIDLENGDIDDDERELEAFKRFCLQSVPSERKNKVKVNLNIKDIVLKKKSSAIGCS